MCKIYNTGKRTWHLPTLLTADCCANECLSRALNSNIHLGRAEEEEQSRSENEEVCMEAADLCLLLRVLLQLAGVTPDSWPSAPA